MRQATTDQALEVERIGTSVKITGFFPIDPWHATESHQFVNDWKKKLGEMNEKNRKELMNKMGILNSPDYNKDRSYWSITCSNCKRVQGYVWSNDIYLNDWANFHYYQWTDGEQWYGCFTPHVSPISGILCLECCCGADSRDFRANMTNKEANIIEESNRVGRAWGQEDSKFKLNPIRVKI